jgi:hypothetical protein
MVAGHHRRFKRFGQGNVDGVVRGDVLSQPPCTAQEIRMRVAMEIEVREIGNCLLGASGRDFIGSHQTSKALNYLDVQEVGRVEFISIAEEPYLHSHPKLRLEEKLQHRRRVDHDHADSRSSRMTTAAGVFNVTRLRLWSRASISSRVGRAARRSSSASR